MFAVCILCRWIWCIVVEPQNLPQMLKDKARPIIVSFSTITFAKTTQLSREGNILPLMAGVGLKGSGKFPDLAHAAMIFINL